MISYILFDGVIEPGLINGVRVEAGEDRLEPSQRCGSFGSVNPSAKANGLLQHTRSVRPGRKVGMRVFKYIIYVICLI